MVPERRGDDVGSDPGSHGNHRCRAGEGNRLDRQLSLHALSANSNSSSASSSPMSVIGMLTFTLLLLMAFLVFHVPVKGSFGALALGALLYVFSTCGFGQLVSTFTRTQVAAVFATTVLAVIPTVNFSGLLVPVSSLTGQGRLIGLMFPAAWFHPISVGTFTKGLGYSDLWFNALVLASLWGRVPHCSSSHAAEAGDVTCRRRRRAAGAPERATAQPATKAKPLQTEIGTASCGGIWPTFTG